MLYLCLCHIQPSKQINDSEHSWRWPCSLDKNSTLTCLHRLLLVYYVFVIQFWSELSLQARQKLLRIDKQSLFEQARKNMYCSRCNGLLLEGFLQIATHGKSLQQEGVDGHFPCNRSGGLRKLNNEGLSIINGCQDEIQDPSIHPWGGLTTARDGSLTLMSCYLYSKSLKGLQIVSVAHLYWILMPFFSLLVAKLFHMC